MAGREATLDCSWEWFSDVGLDVLGKWWIIPYYVSLPTSFSGLMCGVLLYCLLVFEFVFVAAVL